MIKRSKLFAFSILVTILCISLFYFILPLEKISIPASFVLAKNAGFDIAPGQLTFGAINENTISKRNITIANNFNKNVIVSIRVKGELSNNIEVSDNNFYLSPRESRNLIFQVDSKGLSDYKNYSGEVIITLKRDMRFSKIL